METFQEKAQAARSGKTVLDQGSNFQVEIEFQLLRDYLQHFAHAPRGVVFFFGALRCIVPPQEASIQVLRALQ